MNKVELVGKDIQELQQLLENTAADFLKNFNDLNVELTTLTSRGFTGEAAKALIDTYESKVRPALETIAKETQKAADYMAERKSGFDRLMSDLGDNMRG